MTVTNSASRPSEAGSTNLEFAQHLPVAATGRGIRAPALSLLPLILRMFISIRNNSAGIFRGAGKNRFLFA